jgi:hypothetical protein
VAKELVVFALVLLVVTLLIMNEKEVEHLRLSLPDETNNAEHGKRPKLMF